MSPSPIQYLSNQVIEWLWLDNVYEMCGGNFLWFEIMIVWTSITFDNLSQMNQEMSSQSLSQESKVKAVKPL